MFEVQQRDISSPTTSVLCTQTLIRSQHEAHVYELFVVAQLSKGAVTLIIPSAVSSSVALQLHSKGLSPDANLQETLSLMSQTKWKSQGTHQFFLSKPALVKLKTS